MDTTKVRARQEDCRIKHNHFDFASSRGVLYKHPSPSQSQLVALQQYGFDACFLALALASRGTDDGDHYHSH